MFLTAVRNQMTADEAVVADLATWDFGDGTLRPSIHLTDPAPEKASNPVAVLLQTGGDHDDELTNRKERGYKVTINIRVWDDKLETEGRISRLAWNIYDVLEAGNVLIVAGFNFHKCDCSIPAAITDGEGYPGYEMNVDVYATRIRRDVL